MASQLVPSQASPFNRLGVYALPRSSSAFYSTSPPWDFSPPGDFSEDLCGRRAHRERAPYIAHKMSFASRLAGPIPNLPALVRKNLRLLHINTVPAVIVPGGNSTYFSVSSARIYRRRESDIRVPEAKVVGVEGMTGFSGYTWYGTKLVLSLMPRRSISQG